MKKSLTSLAALGLAVSPCTTPPAEAAILAGKIHRPTSRTIELQYDSSVYPGCTTLPIPLDGQDPVP
jgi:hypothetical protein